MSEQSDIDGGGLYAKKVKNAETGELKPDSARVSNQLIFIGFIVSLTLGIAGVIVLAMAPGLLSVQFVIWANVAFFSLATVAAFALYQRANQLKLTPRETTAPGSLVGEMQSQIAALQLEQKNLRRAYREEQLRAEAAGKSKAAFLAHLSHDIRTPLNHIIGFADLVGHQAFGPLGDQRYLTYVNDIKKSGEGLLSSVADVLELAELESGQRILAHDEILVDDLLNSLKSRFADRAQRCAVSLKVECFCAAVIFGDRMGYERLLKNILDNSFRFTPSGGEIRLVAWNADDGVVLEVTDTGIGIPEQRLAALFQPFSDNDGEQARDHGGMGLGLAIARSIAQLSGGELAIDSRPNLGTTVVVSLPLNAQQSDGNIKVA